MKQNCAGKLPYKTFTCLSLSFVLEHSNMSLCVCEQSRVQYQQYQLRSHTAPVFTLQTLSSPRTIRTSEPEFGYLSCHHIYLVKVSSTRE